jgi:hypothetical protein
LQYNNLSSSLFRTSRLTPAFGGQRSIQLSYGRFERTI